MTYRIVGIDFSLSATGVARIVDGNVKTTVIRSSGRKGASLSERLIRIRQIVKRIKDFALEGYDPDADGPLPLFVIEAPLYTTPMRTNEKGDRVPLEGGGHMHDRSGAWWLLLHLLAKEGLIVEVSTSTLKKYITGRGNSGKEASVMETVRTYPDIYVGDNNAADALVLAAMGARQLGRPIEASEKRITATALNGVRWPNVVERP